MQNAPIIIDDDYNGLEMPAAKRQKLEAKFSDLHQRVLQKDTDALLEILSNPVHAHKFNVINSVAELNPEYVLEVIDEAYSPLVSALLRPQYLRVTLLQISKSDYATAKDYAERLFKFWSKSSVISFPALLIETLKLIEKKTRPLPNRFALQKGIYDLTAVCEVIIGLSSQPSCKEDLLDNYEIIDRKLKILSGLVSHEMGDLEKVFVVLYKNYNFFQNILSRNQQGYSLFFNACRMQNYQLAKELYLLPEYNISMEAYLEFMMFQVKSQHLYDFSFARFMRVGAATLQHELAVRIQMGSLAPSMISRVYGSLPEKYFTRCSFLEDFFTKRYKALKPTDVSEDAQVIRKYQEVIKATPLDVNIGLQTDLVNLIRSSLTVCVNARFFNIINRQMKQFFSPVEMAINLIANNQEDILQELINLGIDVNYYFNKPPLAEAVERGLSLGHIKLLLNAGASPYLESHDPKKNAILVALSKRRYDVLDSFYQRGFALDFCPQHLRPTNYAIENDDIEMLRFLLERNVPYFDYEGWTMLDKAVYQSKLGVVKGLLHLGYGSIRGKNTGKSALAFVRNADVAKVLIQYGLDPHEVFSDNSNFLTACFKTQDAKLIRLAMNLGVAPRLLTKELIGSLKSVALRNELLKYTYNYSVGLIQPKSFFEVFPMEMQAILAVQANSTQETNYMTSVLNAASTYSSSSSVEFQATTNLSSSGASYPDSTQGVAMTQTVQLSDEEFLESLLEVTGNFINTSPRTV